MELHQVDGVNLIHIFFKCLSRTSYVTNMPNNGFVHRVALSEYLRLKPF